MSDMSHLYRAYAAVHNTEVKTELTEARNEISKMNLGQLTDADLVLVAEEVIAGFFKQDYTAAATHEWICCSLEESVAPNSSPLRKDKVRRLAEAFDTAFEKVYERAVDVCEESFLHYMNSKPLVEKWQGRVSHEQGNQKIHNSVIAKDRQGVLEGLIKMVEGVRDLDPEKGTKERKERLEKKRGMKLDDHPEYKAEEFQASTIRKEWASAYKGIYEKKLDPVGQEDDDIDNDGDVDSSDKYLHKRRKAIGKAMGKKQDVKEVVVPALVGGTLGAVTGGKRKVKKAIGAGAGAAAGAALGGPLGAVAGGLLGGMASEGTMDIRGFEIPKGQRDAAAKRIAAKTAKKKANLNKEEVEQVDELYKGKHGQSEKEYADSRSPGGKMVSGDSKQSGAEYTHGRRVKAANPGMQPDVGGKTRPKSQGKMDAGSREDLMYRKVNLKRKHRISKILNTEEVQIDEISSHLALTASQKADEERRKAAVAGDTGRAKEKARQASSLYKGVGPRKTKERMGKIEEVLNPKVNLPFSGDKITYNQGGGAGAALGGAAAAGLGALTGYGLSKMGKKKEEKKDEVKKEGVQFSAEELARIEAIVNSWDEGYQREPDQAGKKDRTHSKQPDPSKPGFTGVGNMSIAQIAKMSKEIEKKKK